MNLTDAFIIDKGYWRKLLPNWKTASHKIQKQAPLYRQKPGKCWVGERELRHAFVKAFPNHDRFGDKTCWDVLNLSQRVFMTNKIQYETLSRQVNSVRTDSKSLNVRKIGLYWNNIKPEIHNDFWNIGEDRANFHIPGCVGYFDSQKNDAAATSENINNKFIINFDNRVPDSDVGTIFEDFTKQMNFHEIA